jgi:hypothetical protein
MTCRFSTAISITIPPTHLVRGEALHLEPFKARRSRESDVGLAFLEDFAEIDLDPVESWRVSQDCDGAAQSGREESWGRPPYGGDD